MLPTFSKSNLYLTDESKLVMDNMLSDFAQVDKQHFYIISNDDINFGDWYYNPVLKKVQKKYSKEQDYIKRDNCNKIIASSDKSITPNSWIPESFVNAYIKSFNEGKTITEVDLEMTSSELEHEIRWDIAVRKDFSVIIHQSKMYSKIEVTGMLYLFGIEIFKRIKSNDIGNFDQNQWIEENL